MIIKCNQTMSLGHLVYSSLPSSVTCVLLADTGFGINVYLFLLYIRMPTNENINVTIPVTTPMVVIIEGAHDCDL